MKSYFLIQDNVLDKKIQRYIDEKAFTSKKNVKNVIHDIIDVFAKNFTDGDERKARSILMKEHVEIRRKDAILLSFFSGTLLITTLITLTAILLPPADPNHSIIDWEEIVLTLPVYRFVFMLILGLFFIATDVMLLRRFKVNYLFIFELDPHYKVTHVQLFRVAMMLLTIFMLCFMGQIMVSKLEYLFDPPNAICPLALITIFIILCFLPFHVFYLRTRKELSRVLFNILLSPFGTVKFKHFFLADILTSMV